MNVNNHHIRVTSVDVQGLPDQNSGVAAGQAGAAKSLVNLTIDPSGCDTGTKTVLTLAIPEIAGFQLSDRVLTELEGFLETKLGVTTADDAPWQAIGPMAMTLMLADALADLAGQVVNTSATTGQLSDNEMKSLANSFEALGGQANATVAYFSDLMSSGGFPDGHVKFLKMMLEVAQELRDMASTAKMEASKGEFENTMAIAEQMVKVADHTYNEKIKSIDAEVKAAWISFGVAVGTAVASAAAAGYAGRSASDATKATQKGTAEMPDMALDGAKATQKGTAEIPDVALDGAKAAQESTATGASSITRPRANAVVEASSRADVPTAAAKNTGAMAQYKMTVFDATQRTASSIANPLSTLATSSFKVEAAEEGRLADYGRAVVKEMEAAGKMMSEVGDTLRDLKEVAKKLEAFILNLAKELIAQQLQLVQRSNV